MEKGASLRSTGVAADGQGRVPVASSRRGVETSRAAHACLARQPRGLVKRPLIGPVSRAAFTSLASLESTHERPQWRRGCAPARSVEGALLGAFCPAGSTA